MLNQIKKFVMRVIRRIEEIQLARAEQIIRDRTWIQ